MTSRPGRSLPASKETDASRQMIPSRSYHHDESGLPMISLILSSSNNGSMGRRNGRINSKLIRAFQSDGSPASAELPQVKRRGLFGLNLFGNLLGVLLLRGSLCSA